MPRKALPLEDKTFRPSKGLFCDHQLGHVSEAAWASGDFRSFTEFFCGKLVTAFQSSSSLCVSSGMAESPTGKPKQLTCHCVAPTNPLENNNSLKIKLSSSMSVTGFQVRKPVLWVHSLNTCLNKFLHPMDILPIPWLEWIKVLSSWHGCWHSSPICSHLCVWYFPERTNLPAVPRCFQTAQDTLSGTTFTPV